MNKTIFIAICVFIWVLLIGSFFYEPGPSQEEAEFILIHGEIEDSCYPHICDVIGEEEE